ncbi:MAG: methylated-DNA--[protein]-cysteine S-methyltransferase [Myxococcota bacterium]
MTAAGVSLLVARRPSPLGSLVVVCDRADRLRALDFADCEARMRRLLRASCGGAADAAIAGRAPAAVASALDAFFAGDLGALAALEVRTAGTSFQRSVWAALREIPAGATTTYSALARAIGRPTACRAVGLANGANPIAIATPCHRVLGSDGSLTGYAGGVGRKRWLLDHERRWRH